MTPEAKKAYDLVLEIRDAESEIEQLEETKRRLENQLNLLIGGGNSNIGNAGQLKIMGGHLGNTVRRGRVASDNSAQKRIEKLLVEFPDRDFDGEMVARELEMNLGTARTNLSKLATHKIIEKRSSNTYGAIRQEKEATSEETAS